MRDESDQKELVLGNKQLLSIFFIVVAMLGVAFTLGYMIGRNTANVSAAGVSPATTQMPPADNPSPSRRPVETPVAQAPPPDSPVVTPAPEPVPAAAEPKITGTRPAKPYDSETSHAVAPVTAAPAAAPASYLQIAAMKRPDADHMASTLRDRGFPALVRESSKEGLFRVLVGPYADLVALGDAKQKIKAAGFDNPIVAH